MILLLISRLYSAVSHLKVALMHIANTNYSQMYEENEDEHNAYIDQNITPNILRHSRDIKYWKQDRAVIAEGE